MCWGHYGRHEFVICASSRIGYSLKKSSPPSLYAQVVCSGSCSLLLSLQAYLTKTMSETASLRFGESAAGPDRRRESSVV